MPTRLALNLVFVSLSHQFFFSFQLHLFLCVSTCRCHSTYVGDTGQLTGLGFPLPPSDGTLVLRFGGKL